MTRPTHGRPTGLRGTPRERYTPPRILAIADRPGWAIDRKTQNLRRVLEGRFEVVQRFQHDVTESDVNAADIVLIFYWLQFSKLALPESVFARRSDRLVIGICGHRELEGEFREPGLATLRRLARAVFVNNRRLEHEYRPLLRVPVHYTPNGVDTTFFCPHKSHNPILANSASDGREVSATMVRHIAASTKSSSLRSLPCRACGY